VAPSGSAASPSIPCTFFIIFILCPERCPSLIRSLLQGFQAPLDFAITPVFSPVIMKDVFLYPSEKPGGFFSYHSSTKLLFLQLSHQCLKFIFKVIY
jgi:hypothetical protein